MIRELVALSALLAVASAVTTTASSKIAAAAAATPCIYPYYEQGAFKTGHTTCSVKTVATDCADSVVDCIYNIFTRTRICCRQKTGTVAPICPNSKALYNPNKNKAIIAWVACDPDAAKAKKRAPCPKGYNCVVPTNAALFTHGSSTMTSICCAS